MGEAKRKKEWLKEQEKIANEVMEGKTPQEKAVIAAHMANKMGKPMRPADMKVISFIHDRFDSCTDKIVGDFGRVLTNKGYAPLIMQTANFRDSLEYVSDHIVLFRLGFYPESEKFIRSVNEFRQYMRRYGVRSVYYADDHIWPSTNGAPIHLAQNSDKVIVTSEYIRQVAQKLCNIGKPIYILPTHIDLERFDKVEKVKWKDKKFRVLYTSQGGIGLSTLVKIVEKMNEDPEEYKDVEIILSCSQVGYARAYINKYRNVNKRYFDWLSVDNFYALAKSCDVLIAPAEPEDCRLPGMDGQSKIHWINSKSEVKYCLAGAGGIPIIASPTNAYSLAIQDQQNGLLATSSDDFLKWINVLRYAPDFAESIGKAARADVEKKYDSKARALQFLDILLHDPTVKAKAPAGVVAPVNAKTIKRLFIPFTEGGPQSFERNMTKWLPLISRGRWEVTNKLEDVDAVMSIAFILKSEIEIYKADHPNVDHIFRVDGLPMHFDGRLQQEQLQEMLNLFGQSHKIVWQSEHCKKFWRSYGVDTTKGFTIPNGVDLEVFRPDGTKAPLPSSEAEKFKILHLNWSTFPHKRFDYLKEFGKWLTRVPNAENIMMFACGNYASVQEIENIKFFDGHPTIKYIGSVQDKTFDGMVSIAQLLRSVDALVFTSEMEGSPHTLLEAMASGLLIFSNPQSDIVDEICGTLRYPISGVPDLTNAMAEIGQPDVRRAKQKAIRELAFNYSTQIMVQKYLDMLEA